MITSVILVACSTSDTSGPPACAVTAVSVTPSPGTIEVGETVALSASITQTNCTGLTTNWSSSNGAVASVSSSGVVTGVTPGGPVTITATVGGQSGNVSVTVVPPAVASISLALPWSIISVNGHVIVTPTLKDAGGNVLTGRAVTWSSGNAAVASVTDGDVTGVALGGPVDITATSEGVSATVQVRVAGRYAYAYAPNPSASAPYTAPPQGSYNSTGGPITITRMSAGLYEVQIAGMAFGNVKSAVLAHAFGSGSAACVTVGWNDAGNDLVAEVACRDGTGAFSDQRFLISVFDADAFPGRFGFAWASQASAGAPYVPSSLYSFNASGQPIQITRTAVGTYSVVFSGNGRAALGDPAEVFHVTAYGNGTTRCEVISWDYFTAEVDIRCADHVGTPTDSRFVVLMLEAGRPGMRHASAWVNCGAASCTPHSGYLRSTGGAVQVTRLSSGRYDVVFAGLARITGTDNVMVTSYGTNGGICKVIAFDNSGQNDFMASVQCFGPAGAAADRLFDIVVVP